MIGVVAQISKQGGRATGPVAAAVGLGSDENSVDLCQHFGIVGSQRGRRHLGCHRVHQEPRATARWDIAEAFFQKRNCSTQGRGKEAKLSGNGNLPG